ncbi:NepR family anti-sigma factor [uncultured Methylobacterium sp.]
MSDQTQLRLGNHLRAMYDNVLQQPVPDRFRELIERLETRQPDP